MVGRLIFVTLIFLTLGMVLSPCLGAASDPALEAYHRGVAAKTIGEREAAIEKALELNLARFGAMKVEGEINGWLCYNIGNCYFVLKQIGEAVYYYRQALYYLPGNEKITGNLNVALQERENGVDVEPGGINEILLFFHYKISMANRIALLIISSIITALFLAGLIVKSNTFFRYGTGIAATTLISLSLSIFIQYYYPDHMGVITRTADIRRDAGAGFAPVTAQPFSAGSSIRVISLDNGWFQVRLNDGRKGYVEQDKLKLVQ
jgi:hypothetical protein